MSRLCGILDSNACLPAARKRRLSSPWPTKGQIGALSVTYSGISRLSSPCTIRSCRRNLSPAASISYTLPDWLANHMISIWLKSASTAGPELLLKTRRVVQTDAYYTAERGNLAALHQMYFGWASRYT